MSEGQRQQPAKKQNRSERGFLQDLRDVPDDEESSATSSSDYEPEALPLRRHVPGLPSAPITPQSAMQLSAHPQPGANLEDGEETTSSDASTSEEETSSNDSVDASEENPVHDRRQEHSHPRVTSDLQSRLQQFLPQLQQANAELNNESDGMTRRLDVVEQDADQYIEMDLSLGVLEAQAPDQVDLLRPGGASLVAAPGPQAVQEQGQSNDTNASKRKIEEVER